MKIKLLVVDDSAFMRVAIKKMLGEAPDIEIAGFASNGQQALEMFEQVKPDVVTLDIEMPIMDGLTALKEIMKRKPTPVIMVSSLTQTGADSTMEALSLGAVDFIPKPSSFVSLNIKQIKQDLIDKIRAASKTILTKLKTHGAPLRLDIQPQKINFDIVVIGVSTGGPSALQEVIPRLPENFKVPVAVVQHMPKGFTLALANRLNGLSANLVKESEENERLEAGKVLICQAGQHSYVKKGVRGYFLSYSNQPSELFHKPAVDVLFKSAAEQVEKRCLGVIMTGMGKDGLIGAKVLKLKGGKLIAQDEETSVVYGMPRVVAEENLTDKIAPLEKIAESIVRLCYN